MGEDRSLLLAGLDPTSLRARGFDDIGVRERLAGVGTTGAVTAGGTTKDGFIRPTRAIDRLTIGELNRDYAGFKANQIAFPNALNDPQIEASFDGGRARIGALDLAVDQQLRADGLLLLKAYASVGAVLAGGAGLYAAGGVLAGGGTLTLGQAAGASVAADVGLAALPGIANGSFDMGPTVGGTLLNPITGGRGELAYAGLTLGAGGVALGRAGLSRLGQTRAVFAAEQSAISQNRITNNFLLDSEAGYSPYQLVAPVVPHKNSLGFVGQTDVYGIYTSSGSLFKIGETAQGRRASDGLSIRGQLQARALSKQTGDFSRSKIIQTFPNKSEARAFETQAIKDYTKLFGQRPPGNKVDR